MPRSTRGKPDAAIVYQFRASDGKKASWVVSEPDCPNVEAWLTHHVSMYKRSTEHFKKYVGHRRRFAFAVRVYYKRGHGNEEAT